MTPVPANSPHSRQRHAPDAASTETVSFDGDHHPQLRHRATTTRCCVCSRRSRCEVARETGQPARSLMVPAQEIPRKKFRKLCPVFGLFAEVGT